MSGKQGRCSLKRKSSRRERNTIRHVLTWIKVMVGFVILGALVHAGSELKSHIENMPETQLSEVVVIGAEQVDPEDIKSTVRACSPECILLADLERIRESVETLPWVSEATIIRRLPDTLIVRLTEREPVAVAGVDNKLYVVDSHGIILDPFTNQQTLLSQPVVKGLKHQLRGYTETFNHSRMKLYLEALEEFQSGTEDYSETISEIDVTNPENVSVIPKEDPVVIYLGDRSFRERYQSFLSRKQLYHQIKKQYGTLQYIDISFEKQIIFRTEKREIAG